MVGLVEENITLRAGKCQGGLLYLSTFLMVKWHLRTNQEWPPR